MIKSTPKPQHVLIWGVLSREWILIERCISEINVLILKWPNGVKCWEKHVVQHTRNLACRYGCWL